MSAGLIAVLVVLGILVLFVIGIFNRLITLKNRMKEAWAQIDVQLKQRSDLIPNLVETVKGYAAHEKDTLQKVIEARSQMQSAGSDVNKVKEADNFLSSTLKSLFAVTENYPQLKADAHFSALMTELSGIESKIAYARQFYNETIKMYNDYQQQFPGVIFAGIFGHSAGVFFEAAEADRVKPVVKF